MSQIAAESSGEANIYSWDRSGDRRWVPIQGDSECDPEYDSQAPSQAESLWKSRPRLRKSLLIARTTAEFLGIIRDVGFY